VQILPNFRVFRPGKAHKYKNVVSKERVVKTYPLHGCEEQGVECAPAPVRIIEKGLASDRVVIDTVVSNAAMGQELLSGLEAIAA